MLGDQATKMPNEVTPADGGIPLLFVGLLSGPPPLSLVFVCADVT